MRFRTDSWNYADLKTHGWTRERFLTDFGSDRLPDYVDEFEATPIAEPGDVWRIHWHSSEAIAGYAICCIKCRHVHAWTTATNCQFNRQTHTYKDQNGVDQSYSVCGHSGTGSCWAWSGSAEEGTLTASPSLQVLDKECGFHGYIENGVLRNC